MKAKVDRLDTIFERLIALFLVFVADLWSKGLVWHPCQVIEICLLARHFNMSYYAFLQLGVWMGTTWLLWKLSELFGEGVGSCNEWAPSGGGVVILLVTSCYWDVVNQGSNRPLGNKRCYLSLLCLFVALFYQPNFAWSVIYYGTDTQQHGIYLLTL